MSLIRAAAVVFCVLTALPVPALVHDAGKPADPRVIEPGTVSPQARKLDPNETTEQAARARQFLSRQGGQWQFVADRRTGRVDLVQGSGVALIPGRGNTLGPAALAGLPLPDGAIALETLEPLARGFIEANGDLVAPPVGKLTLNRETSAMREEGRLISLHFDWSVGGVPVEKAQVFVRVNSGNVTQFGAPLIADLRIDTRPALPADVALDRLMTHSGDGELYRLEGEPQLLIQPEDGKTGGIDYRLIWRVVYRIPGRIETWEGRIDAQTGAIVGFRDTNLYARAVGGVYPRTVYDDDEIIVPFPLLTVSASGSTLTTDTAGFFSYSGGGSVSGLNGIYFDTNCQGCTNPSQPLAPSTLSTGRVDFGLGGDDEVGNGFSTPADRNSHFHLNQIRRLGIKWLSNSFLDSTITSNVNISDTCNAVYNGAVNFYRSGGGCNNTGEVADVMYHEWGHGLDLNTQGGDGASGEATADVVSMHLVHSPLVGPGFRTDGSPVRNIDPAGPRGPLSTSNIASKCPVIGTLGPLGFEVHCEGEIYGQAAWELSQALVAKYGHHTGWRASERIFFTSLPDAGSYLPTGSSPIYTAYMNADDDDGDLDNGTPNAQEIFDAFDKHGMATVLYATSAGCTRPAQPLLTVTEQCDRFDLSWSTVAGATQYELFRTELRDDSAFFPVAVVAAPGTAHTDSEVAPGIDYTYVVMAVDAAGCESTIEGPLPARLTAQPMLAVAGAVGDDTPRGNRSGFADPGEEVDLILGLTNVGEVDGTAVSGTVVAASPGVTLLDGAADWPGVPVGGLVDNLDTLRFVTDEGQISCGDTVEFQFVGDDASGCTSEISYFEVPIGQILASIRDDFETASGWALDAGASTAATGDWVRGDPQATVMQPGDDVSPAGTSCWYTGSNPGGVAGTDDVDEGETVLLSPVYDLSGLTDVKLSYYRWFGHNDPGDDPGDFFTAEANDGSGWVTLEYLDSNQSATLWTRVEFDLAGLITLNDQVRFRFRVADAAGNGAIVEAAIDEFELSQAECDDTPACFDEPSFAGVGTVAAGLSCGEVDLSWSAASSNCIDATLSYSIYRSTDPGFTPGPATQIAAALTTTSFTDTLLTPGQSYSYVVRAFDSRSGEDSNVAVQSAPASAALDVSAPLFSGLGSAQTGGGCGETLLSWAPAQESCSGPLTFEIYRSTDPAFTPGPASRIGSTGGLSFVDVALAPDSGFTYVVRARDGVGNEDANDVRLTVDSGALDLVRLAEDFEFIDGAWSRDTTNDTATDGLWAWGDPLPTSYQTGEVASGVNAWITGLLNGSDNDDVDGGTTTLLSDVYDMADYVEPAVAYSRYFTNDRGGAAGEPSDAFRIEVRNDPAGSWVSLETVGAGTPLDWIDVEIPLDGAITATSLMQFRFVATDAGTGSLVEAGIDDFELLDLNQGCSGCAVPVNTVGSILLDRSGDDVVLDWTADPVVGERFVVYALSGPGFGEALRLGTVDGRTFVHQDGVLAGDDFYYRVTAVDTCGAESDLD